MNITIKGNYQELNHSLPFQVVCDPNPDNRYKEVTVYAFELAEDAVKVCQWCNDTFSGAYSIGGQLTTQQMEAILDAGY